MNLRESLHHDVSDSVQLILLKESDAPELFALTMANQVGLREWLPWLDTIQKEEDTLKFIQRSQMAQLTGTQLAYAIWHQGTLAGVITLFLNGHNRCGTLGYWLGKEHEGNGLVTRSCVTLMAHLFLDLDFHRAEIRIAPGNTPSRAIAQRLGFRIDGTLREVEWMYDHFKDSVVYSLLRREWEHVSENYLF
jgi:ribosomal-protein-serine acetyltransferase